MDLQNSYQKNIPPTSLENGNKGPGVAFGVFVGIVQPIVMYFVVTMLAQQVRSVSVLSSLSILLAFLPLILEVIFWRKKYPHFVKGVAIGTILVPLIGLGLCFALLSGLNF